MDKLPVGQLPDLQQSNNDDEIMVITNSEYNQLKKEKISDLITDFTSTNENNALTKGTDGKMFVTDFGNASNITEGTLPTSVLPEIPLEKIPDIPKDKLPQIETDDLPDSGITAGTYTYPTDIVVNSKGQVTSITEGQAGANNANQDLSNLGPLGLDKINQSKALETGSVSSDADVYADIQKYAHSTFDKSKFTVVGSPTITDDGVASEFSYGDYVKVTTFNSTGKNNFVIEGSFTTGTDIQVAQCIFYTTKFSGFLIAYGKPYIGISSDGTSQNIFRAQNINYQLKTNTKYYYRFIFTGTAYILEIGEDISNLTSINIVNSTEMMLIDNLLIFGIGGTLEEAFGNILAGSIDLKNFSITVDGVEVFSGNKTGIDTIKANNYEVVGSPVISEDGVASGFSTSNYISINPIIQLGDYNSWELVTPEFTTSNDLTTFQAILFATYGAYYGGIQIYVNTSGKLSVQLGSTTSSDRDLLNLNSFGVSANTKYRVKLVFTGTKYYAYYSVNGGAWVEYGNLTSSTKVYSIWQYIKIGVESNSSFPFKGQIDLNSFKIYVDGNLVYQPCLKIPYTQSKTGSKIVDVAYRDRVQDVYEQYGTALYYTIDKTNQNFSLPMGEIYGMLEGKKQNAHAIGEPIIRLDNTLYSNEIRLEGALVSKTTYADLYKVYGDNYAIATEDITDETKFYLPDFRNRAVWGSSGFGYLGAGLPPITGTIKASNIWAGTASASGCFSVTDNGDHNAAGNGSSRGRTYTWTLNASSSSSIYGNSDTVQPPAIKVRVVTRFKDEDYPIVIESGNTNNSDGLDDILG